MSASSFNAKKSWDTGKAYSRHVVRMAEERKANEQRKLEELQKQVEEERELEALHMARFGNTEQLKSRRLEWMYQAPTGSFPRGQRDQGSDGQPSSEGGSSGSSAHKGAGIEGLVAGPGNKIKAPVFGMSLGTGLSDGPQQRMAAARSDLLARISQAGKGSTPAATAPGAAPITARSRADEWVKSYEDPLRDILALQQQQQQQQRKPADLIAQLRSIASNSEFIPKVESIPTTIGTTMGTTMGTTPPPPPAPSIEMPISPQSSSGHPSFALLLPPADVSICETPVLESKAKRERTEKPQKKEKKKSKKKHSKRKEKRSRIV